MTNPLPPLNSLRGFEAAGRLLSFTRAAQELRVTPAAISHQIKTLEDYLGVQLFRRSPQGLLLTDAGQQALPVVSDGFRRLVTAVSMLRRSQKDQPLTVSASPSFAAKWLVPRIEGFRVRHPGIEVRIDASSRLADFQSDDLDVGIRYGLGDYPGLHVERLPAQEVFPVCSPVLLKGDKPLRRPADLRQHTLLHVHWRGPGRDMMTDWRTWLTCAGVTDLDPDAGPGFSQESMAMQAAAEGHGVALANTHIAADDLATGRLVRPFAHTFPDAFSYFLVCLPEMTKTVKVAAFRAWLHDEIGCTS